MSKGPRKQRTKSDVPGSSGVKPSNGSKPGDNSKNLTFDDERELFLSHHRKRNAALAKLEVAKKAVSDVEAEARGDGFTKKMLDIARDLATTSGESKITGEVGDRLKVARFIGHKLGEQYDLFERPLPAPSVDVAFDQGKQASMENQAARPPYDPSTPQYKAYMDGFHEHQATLAGGIKSTDDKDVRPRHVTHPDA